MQIIPESDTPIFLQIAEGIEDAILSGAFPEESQAPSITDFSVQYKINPATALKGINLLVDAGILYKKRGLGMFVKEGAVEQLRTKRKDSFQDTYIKPMLTEAKRLNISASDILTLIEREISHEHNHQ